MDELSAIRIVEQIHRRADALFESNERAGHTAVVTDGADSVPFGDIGEHRPNVQSNIGRSGLTLSNSTGGFSGERLQPVRKDFGDADGAR